MLSTDRPMRYFTERFGKSALRRPLPINNAIPDYLNGDSSLFRPFSHAQYLAVMCEFVRRPFVAVLFGGRSPFAVSWFIVAVIVQSLNFKPFRTWPHVFKEIGEVLPSFAQLYSTSAVIGIARFARILAAFLNAAPNRIFRRAIAVPTMAVSKARRIRAIKIAFVATATQRCTMPEGRSGYHSRYATFAAALPIIPAMPKRLRSNFENGPTTVCVTS